MTMLATECSRYGVGFRLMLFTAAALSLAACSSSAGRFADVSDVNTSSLPAEQATDTQSQPLQPSERPAWQNASTSAGAKSGSIVVESGQTLYSIARANDLTADQLAAANSIPPPYAIRVGQTLKVPGRADPVTPSAPPSRRPFRRPMPPRSGRNSVKATHVVRPGETLFAVGRAYQIDPFAIAQYNRLSEPYALKVGQTLRIPSSEPTASRPSGSPTTLDQQLAERQAAPREPERRARRPRRKDRYPAGPERHGRPAG
jgi:LysM repeat protein